MLLADLIIGFIESLSYFDYMSSLCYLCYLYLWLV